LAEASTLGIVDTEYSQLNKIDILV